MTNVDPRNDPDGYALDEPPQRYLIRRVAAGGLAAMGINGTPGSRYQIRGTVDPAYQLGEVEEHQTVVTFDGKVKRWFHALAEEDQLYADLCTRIIQRSCGYFFDKDWAPTPHAGVVVTDAQVRESIWRLDLGENRREALRTGKPRYVLTDLPWHEQRGLIMALYNLRQEWGFEKLGPVSPPAAAPYAFLDD